jgi:hypothetical protein
MVPASEPGHGDDITDDGSGDDRPGAEDLGEAGAGCPGRGGQLLAGLAPLAVQVADVGQQFGGELAARLAGRAQGPDLAEDPGGLACGDLLGNAARNQPAAAHAAGRRPGCGPGKDRGAFSPTPSAHGRGHRRSHPAGSWTAAPPPPPAGHRSGRSCRCSRFAAAAPGQPAWAARPAPAHQRPPAAGPAGRPAPGRPPPPRSAPATPPPRRPASRPAPGRPEPATRPAAPRPHRPPPRCASPDAGRSRSSLPSAHSTFVTRRPDRPQRASLIPDLRQALAPLPGPRHGKARRSRHIDLKPGTRGPQAVRQPAPSDPSRRHGNPQRPVGRSL